MMILTAVSTGPWISLATVTMTGNAISAKMTCALSGCRLFSGSDDMRKRDRNDALAVSNEDVLRSPSAGLNQRYAHAIIVASTGPATRNPHQSQGNDAGS